jgi:hypothetical protein
MILSSSLENMSERVGIRKEMRGIPHTLISSRYYHRLHVVCAVLPATSWGWVFLGGSDCVMTCDKSCHSLVAVQLDATGHVTKHHEYMRF